MLADGGVPPPRLNLAELRNVAVLFSSTGVQEKCAYLRNKTMDGKPHCRRLAAIKRREVTL